MISTLFYFLSLFLLRISSKKMANIGYMGYGYNIYLGNPTPTEYTYDPGFTFTSIFDLKYTTNKTTSDGEYEIPDNIDAIESVACSFSTTTTIVYGETSYLSSLENSVSISASASYGFVSGRFSASYDWGRVSTETVTNGDFVISASAKCSLFTATFNKYTSLNFTENFNNGVELLLQGDENDEDIYFDFFDTFGTHYFKEQVLGAKIYSEFEFTRSVYNDLVSSSEDFDASVSASLLSVFSISTSYSTSTTETESSTFMSEASSIYLSTIGVSPSTNSSSQWAVEAMESPMPIYYKIATISGLLTTTNFPNCSEALLDRVARRMNYYMSRYCSQMGSTGCAGPHYDYEVAEYSVVSKSGTTVTVSCSGNQSMVGIGFKRKSTSGLPERLTRYMLISTTEGECYDYYGLDCYAICTSAFSPNEVKIINSNYSKGSIIATCPSGYKVSGCGLHISDLNTSTYPDASSSPLNTFCFCYSSSTHLCQAICIPANTYTFTYTIVQEKSSDNFNVSCPGSLQVLGCGYDPTLFKEKFWFVYPQENACHCYNYYGATCYAICADVSHIGAPDCSNCATGYCSKNGCTQCQNGYFLSGKVCKAMPCYNICTTCTTTGMCAVCVNCTQGTSSSNKTCSSSSLIQNGCVPCSYNYYLNPDGYCTLCSAKTDPDKYRNGTNEGTGTCDLCSKLISNCYSCNDLIYTCEKCQDGYNLTDSGSCNLVNQTNLVDYGNSTNSTNSTGQKSKLSNHKKLSQTKSQSNHNKVMGKNKNKKSP